MPYYGHRNWYEHDDTPPDYCPHGVNRAFADCGRCIDEDRDALALEATEALLRAFRQALDRIQQTEDEAKGAHLAARFEKRERA